MNKSQMTYNDYPLEECAKALEERVAEGYTFYQKWTCQGCGARITGNTANKLFTSGHCEHCNHVTNITVTGCNYLLAMVLQNRG
jgi:hypothetical protein